MLVDNRELIGTVSPTVYIDNIRVEEGKVSLSLIVKDSLNENLKSSWFGNNDFERFIKIAVCEISDKDTHLVMKDALSKNIPVDLSYLARIESEGFDINRDKINFVSYNLRDSIENSIVTTKTYSKDSAGNKITNFVLTHDKDISERNEFLSFICFSYIDFSEFNEVFGGNEISSNKGTIKSDIVFDNFETVKTVSYFYDSLNNVWPGAVHQMSDGRWMKGLFHIEGQEELLTRKEIPNIKLHDFRMPKLTGIDKIRGFSIEKINPSKLLRNKDKEGKPKSDFFTNLWASRTTNNDLHFVFGLDKKKLIVENSKYSDLINLEDEEILQEIMNNSSFQDIRLSRKRVKKNIGPNSIGTLEYTPDEFDDLHEPFEYVKSELQSNLEEMMFFSEFSVYTKPLKFYSFSDSNLKDKTFGNYQYSIKFIMDDGIYIFLKSLYSDLVREKANLDKYINEAGLYYNYVYRRFKQSFISMQNRKYEESLQEAPWISSLVSYSKAFYVLTGNPIDNSEQLNISNIISPYGNLEGLETFTNEYDKIINYLQIILEVSSNSRNSKGVEKIEASPRSANYGSSSRTSNFIIEHTFTDTFVDAESLNTSGILYFDGSERNIQSLSSNSFDERKESIDELLRGIVSPQMNPISLVLPHTVFVNNYPYTRNVLGRTENENMIKDLIDLNFPDLLTDTGLKIELIKDYNYQLPTTYNTLTTLDPIEEDTSSDEQVSEDNTTNFRSNLLPKDLKPVVRINEIELDPQAMISGPIVSETTGELEQVNFDDTDISEKFQPYLDNYVPDFSLMGKIEYLESFERGTERDLLLKADKWRTLNTTAYFSRQPEMKSLLCRIVPSSRFNDSIGVGIYNQYFLLERKLDDSELQTPNQEEVTQEDDSRVLDPLGPYINPTSMIENLVEQFGTLGTVSREMSTSDLSSNYSSNESQSVSSTRQSTVANQEMTLGVGNINLNIGVGNVY